MFVEQHPLAVNLDVDVVRSLIGNWRSRVTEAGLLARSMVLAAAEAHLRAGFDVVIPQYLGVTTFLEQAERLSEHVGARFQEITLMDTAHNAVRRFFERDRLAEDPAHRVAQEMVDEAGGVAELVRMYERLQEVIAARPNTQTVWSVDGQPDRAFRDLLAHVGPD